MLKIIAIVVGLVAILGGGAVYYQLHKPAPSAANGKAILFRADDLAKEYNKDEKAADAKYLNKVIEVTGMVSEVDNNQDGGIMAILQTTDPSVGIQCTMREKKVVITKGQEITIRGFCSGNGITGISLTDCIIKTN